MKLPSFAFDASVLLYRKLLLRMKLTAIILLAGLLQVSAHGYAQNVTINIKNASVQQVMKEINRQTGFQFFYDYALLANIGSLDIDVHDAPIRDVLKDVFKNQPVRFEISSNTILIKEKESSTDEYSISLVADKLAREIHGRVLNQEGQPVPGITVTVKGTTQVAVSNDSGEFVLTNVNENTVVVFTGVNMEKMETTIGDRTTMTLTLQIKRSILDDIQVIGYGSTSRKLNTGAQGSMTAEEIQDQPVSNPMMALEGRIAGAEVTQTSGRPGAAINIQIRGLNTAFSATSNPLFVIDGVPVPYLASPDDFLANNPMSNINPGDIENITILKDADATAVYGSRGANGVVLITTKKGKAGATKLAFDASTGFSKAARLMPGLLTTPEYLAMRKTAFSNDGIAPDQDNAPDLTQWSQTQDDNWQKMLIGNTGTYTNVQASLSGGDQRVRYLLSGAYNAQTGIAAGDNYDRRANVHMNIENNSKDNRFYMSTSLTYSNDNTRNVGPVYVLNQMKSAPNMPLYSDDGSIYRNPALYYESPLWSLNSYVTAKSDNFIGNTRLSYLILPNLKASVNLGYNKLLQNGFRAFPSTSINPDNYLPYTNAADFTGNTVQTFVTEPQLDYNTHIGKGKLQALLGGTWQQTQTDFETTSGTNFSSDELLQNIGAAGHVSGTSGSTEYKYESVFLRGTYNWQERYLLNASFRRDGSSRFGNGYKYGNFWSLGAGWIFSNEDFFKKSKSIFNYGKLRGSYGLTGNDQIGDYGYLAFYSPSTIYSGVSGIYSTQVANNNYRWEQTYKADIGLELGAFDSRVLLTIDWYNNKSQNLLVQIPLSTQTGYNSYTGNSAAVVQNKGWEFTLNTVNIKSKDFKWSTSFNLTIPKNTLLAFPGIEESPYASQYKVGNSINSIYEFKFAGISPTTGAPTYFKADGTITDGTATGGGTLVNGTDYYYLGNRDPRFYAGLGNIFSFKGFELNIFFQFSSSQKDNSVLATAPVPPGNLMNTVQEATQGNWSPQQTTALQPPLTTLPYTPGGLGYSTYTSSSMNIISNNYVRLKTLALSWNVPSHWTNSIGFNNIQIYANAQNLLTFTHYNGIDPESNALTPVLRTVTFGLRATL